MSDNRKESAGEKILTGAAAMVVGTVALGALGGLVGGPPGAVLGAKIGAILGTGGAAGGGSWG